MATTALPELPVPHKDLVRYIADHPDTPMTEIMEPYRKWEAQIRTVFAQDRKNPMLEDPHVNVLPLFNQDTKLITTRARDLASETQEEKDRYIMALPDDKRRAHGSPAVVQSLREFQKNFNVFSESSLVDMDWSNVVAAGSSVVNCLLPVPPEFNTTKRKLREYYHEKFCPASDVDLFLYGLTHEEAIEKIQQIERAIRDAILTEVTVVRTKYAITIASQYPTRHVQIVLRVYKSIGEILTGFDIDAAGGAYDGQQVWVAPRALGSFITQINHIDLSRRSPSYENRLSKYSHRNFEVYWPDLDRNRIDPTIFERSFQRTLGLARLLVLERLPTSNARETYMNKRRAERGRPTVYRNQFRHLGGNIKDNHEDEVADWVDETEVSNYHTFTVPYGPKFHAKKIEKLCYTRDLLLNAEWNQPKEREVYLHRHPAFFGRVEDVIQDCCGSCPKPVTPEEIEVAEKEGQIYIAGKVSFLIDDPGRQQIGSFNPLTDDDWTDMAYIGNTARLCQSIVDSDLDDVMDWLAQEGSDPNKRDYTGRSPLHLAVMSSTPDVVRALVDHGSRITARLADGRTALHLAAERGNPEMIKILMEKSIANEEIEEEKEARRKKAKFGDSIDGAKVSQQAKDAEEDDSKTDEEEEEEEDEDSDGELIDGEETEADSHSIATGSFVKVKNGEDEAKDDIVPEDSTDEPDFYKIDVLSWDIPCSPLHLAIAAGHEEVVALLCDYGSDALLPVKFLNSDKQPTGAILTLALALSLPLDKAKSMAKLLLKLGATSSQADLNGCTVFHRYVEKAESAMIDSLWDMDKIGVKAALNHLIIGSSYWNPQAVSPLHTAIGREDTVLVMRLLEAGANAEIDFESWLKAAKFSKSLENRLSSFEENKKTFNRSVEQPLMVAIRCCPDPEVAYRLLQNGADPNCMTPVSHQCVTDEWQRRYNKGETALDLVREHLAELRKYSGEKLFEKAPELPAGMDEFLAQFAEGSYQHWAVAEDIRVKREGHKLAVKRFEERKKKFDEVKGTAEKKAAVEEIITKMEKVEELMVKMGAKTFKELYPNLETNTNNNATTTEAAKETKKPYEFNFIIRNTTDVTEIRKAAYMDLFEAAWSGNLDKIKSLALQSWDEAQTEAPLTISVTDQDSNNIMSLAFLRGHHNVVRAVLEIAKAQYAPEEKEKSRYTMERENDDESYDEEDSEMEAESDEDSEPRIVARAVDKKFTIENIGQVSMQVKSRVRPLQLLMYTAPTFKMTDGKVTDVDKTSHINLFRFVLMNDDLPGLKLLLDLGVSYASQKLDGDEEEASGYFQFPDLEFMYAVENGKTQLLAEIIKRTGAGLPLDHLVKKSGVEVKDKPRYYQGLTVYGKKRKDWANAGRNLVVKATGVKTPPLLLAALQANTESVEWFLSDAPLRHYVEFGESKAAQTDSRLKHLSETPGGFDRAVSKWLGISNELIMHCVVMGPPTEDTCKLIKYLAETCPATLETRNSEGATPLLTAAWFGRPEFVKVLIAAGADQSVRNKAGQNILHMALAGKPKATQLRAFLQLLDQDLLQHLFISRTNLHESGATPLHYFVSAITTPSQYYWNRTENEYKKEEHWKAALDVLLEFSKGAELEMLNGAGDTCLHTAVMQSSAPMVKALLDFRPKLLYRENAVGRTPAEVARDRVTSELFQQPATITMPSRRNPVTSILGKPLDSFVVSESEEEDDEDEDEEEESQASRGQKQTDKQRVWAICLDVIREHPDKRRLVSLNEANDVAKRLGEKQNTTRYFSIQARGDDSDEEKEEDEEERNAKNKDDFSVEKKKGKWSEAWQKREWQLPLCEKCGKRHEEDEEE